MMRLARTNGSNVRRVPVTWRDCVWYPPIAVRAAAAAVSIRPAMSLPQVFPLCHHGRSFKFKTMKNMLRSSRRPRAGFTLVELLVVIAIIAILAAMTLTALSGASTSAKKMKAKLEAQSIATAIEAYDSAYGRFPVSAAAQNQAVANAKNGLNPDFTYGGNFYQPSGGTLIPYTIQSPNLLLTNDEVIAILMDLTNYPTGPYSINYNHVKNPQSTKFLTAKSSGDNSSPGVGNDLVYRDPWGNPYIITMDLSYDDQCQDVFYCQKLVSQQNNQSGYNGFVNPTDANGNGDHFQFHSKVMVWSAGPPVTGKPVVDPNATAITGANKPHVVSW